MGLVSLAGNSLQKIEQQPRGGAFADVPMVNGLLVLPKEVEEFNILMSSNLVLH
jgi:hypothetical protein